MNSTSLDPKSILALIQRFVGSDPDALDRMRQQLEMEIQTAEQMERMAKAQLAAVTELQELLAREETPPGQQSVPGLGIDARATVGPRPVRPANAPSLRNAIRILLAENAGTRWTREQLLAELTRRGWGPTSRNPKNTLNSRLFEMVRAGQIDRDGDAFSVREEREVPA